MKVKKVNQKSLNSSKGRKLAVAKRKRDLSKVTTEEFLEQNFQDDTDTDSDNDNDEINKNIGDKKL